MWRIVLMCGRKRGAAQRAGLSRIYKIFLFQKGAKRKSLAAPFFFLLNLQQVNNAALHSPYTHIYWRWLEFSSWNPASKALCCVHTGHNQQHTQGSFFGQWLMERIGWRVFLFSLSQLFFQRGPTLLLKDKGKEERSRKKKVSLEGQQDGWPQSCICQQ